RRHTRSDRDWSSDVCSSDLLYTPARHKLVRRHPGSGRDALYIASHASHIVGMPVEEGQALLAELIEFATHPAVQSRLADLGVEEIGRASCRERAERWGGWPS